MAEYICRHKDLAADDLDFAVEYEALQLHSRNVYFTRRNAGHFRK